MNRSKQLLLSIIFSLYTGAVSAKSSEATAMDYNNSSNGIIRHAIRASVPVSAAVELPGCATTVYLSGKLPPIQDHKYTLDSPLAYGGVIHVTKRRLY